MTSLRSPDVSATSRHCVCREFSGASSDARVQSSAAGFYGLTPEHAFARLAKGKALVVSVVMNVIETPIVWVQYGGTNEVWIGHS